MKPGQRLAPLLSLLALACDPFGDVGDHNLTGNASNGGTGGGDATTGTAEGGESGPGESGPGESGPGDPCCAPAEAPGCIEGATCCADGSWACNEGDGSLTCEPHPVAECNNGPGGEPVCGNGVIDEGEECDDANSDDTDGCLSTCVLAPDATEIQQCTATGGVWDPISCGHYQCGDQQDCMALIPGCDCGPVRNFEPGSGCVVDPSCPTVGVAQELCEWTGGTWNPGSCGHYQCGAQPDCGALIPGCDCGPERNFDPGTGCVVDPSCPTVGVEQQLCEWTGGTWNPGSCGHYQCGAQPDCLAVIPGCDCGPARSFAVKVGCFDDMSCN